MSIVHIAGGWLLFVSLSVDGVLFKLGFRSVAVGWQVWAALMVDGWLLVVSWLGNVVLFKLEFRSVDVGWRWRLLWVMVALVVGDVLFRLSLVVVDLLSWMVLLIGAFAAIWLLDEVLSSVFVRRWRIYCKMLVDGFRGFVGLGCWFGCVAAE